MDFVVDKIFIWLETWNEVSLLLLFLKHPERCLPLTCWEANNGAAHRLPNLSPSPRVCSRSYPLSQWWHPTIPSSATLFFCLQSFPVSGSFPMSRLFASGGQSTGASALASVLPMNIQGWFSLGLTGLISLQFKGLWRAFSSTIIWRPQFFGTQPSFSHWLLSLSNIHLRFFRVLL